MVTLTTATLLAWPVTGLAQGSAQPPATEQQPPPTAQAPAAPVDEQAAKQHLTAARNALSEMTQLPAASQLTGDARAQVSQLITNFNELITSSSNWRASHAKVEATLNTLLGTATTDESAARTAGTEGAVGTTGTVALDPAIKAKLIEFRDHLDKFEQAAGGVPASPNAPPAGAMASPASTTAPPAGTTGPPATAATAPATPAAQEPAQGSTVDREELLRHVQAIEAILMVQSPAATGTTGAPPTDPAGATQGPLTLTPAQLDQLRTHLGELKRLLNQR
jgi:hypothetical protein